ncbi:MAG TPA: hypothetical protein VK324_15955 [Tepidisphaeraceae bacterium]|nr:hypothetical protein [Tepidisphaeraceae bacterium]
MSETCTGDARVAFGRSPKIGHAAAPHRSAGVAGSVTVPNAPPLGPPA